MRLGIVTDIHNDHVTLARALTLFRTHDVDQVVTIGDTCDAFAPPDGADEVTALLSNCGAMGVWGNHDFHLCRAISDLCRDRFASATLDFMQQMRPHLELDGCYFSHKDASIDPHDVEQLWSFDDDSLDLRSRAAAGFAAVPNHRQFIGHYHRFWATSETGPLEWNGSDALIMRPRERYFVVIAGVLQGKCAVFDTFSGVLQPLDCGLQQVVE